MGAPFARGVLRAAGVTGDALDLQQKLGGDRPTVLRVVVLFMAVLTSLNLRENNIRAEGAKAIADALGSGRAVLTSIGLRSQRHRRSDRRGSSFPAFAAALLMSSAPGAATLRTSPNGEFRFSLRHGRCVEIETTVPRDG